MDASFGWMLGTSAGYGTNGQVTRDEGMTAFVVWTTLCRRPVGDQCCSRRGEERHRPASATPMLTRSTGWTARPVSERLSGKTNLCTAIRATQGKGLMPDGTSRFSQCAVKARAGRPVCLRHRPAFHLAFTRRLAIGGG